MAVTDPIIRAFDRITEAACPGDPTRHLPNCGYTDEVPECGCAEWGQRVWSALREATADAWAEGHRAALDSVFPLRPEDNPYRGGAA
jgi:hypothetical protein